MKEKLYLILVIVFVTLSVTYYPNFDETIRRIKILNSLDMKIPSTVSITRDS